MPAEGPLRTASARADAGRAAVVDASQERRVRPAASGAPQEPVRQDVQAEVRPPGARAVQPGITAPLPRRRFLVLRTADAPPPMMRVPTFTTSRIRALGRLFVWLWLLIRFGWSVGLDWMRRQNTAPRRAVRLRQAFERAGGTFMKAGQRLAMRLDLLPWEYGAELSRMLDRVPPFPTRHAVAAVEAVAGRPLGEIFESFDPDPVVSTSVACTYQAVLRTGEHVVVKVRRPGIGELVMADLRVFDWLAATLEFLTIVRPGHTRGMRRELRETLQDELDFVQEARCQDLFRRAARKSGKSFFTAPRVYFHLSGEEVIVQESISGMWLWELVSAVEHQDRGVLALAERLNIDPAKIARRLTWINYWAWHEQLFFRADPHPDTVIVGRDGRLTFIDFSVVGTIDRAKQRALQQNMYYAWKRDPLNMARSSLVLLEPLPPVDATELTKELEANNWQMLFAFESRGPQHEWFQRTSAQQWIGLIRLARRYGIVIDFHILQFLRGSVLYDSLAVRLDPEIDVIGQYRRFARYRARRAGRRLRRRLVSRASRGPADDRMYLRLEQLAQTGEGLLFRLRHALTIPRVTFNVLMSKGAFAAYTLIRLSGQVLAAAALYAAAVAGSGYVAQGSPGAFRSVVDQVTAQKSFWVIVAVLALINVRTLLFRMEDRTA